MTETIKTFVATLKSKKAVSNNDLGLFRGKAGLAILYYILSMATDNKRLQSPGLKLLNEISDNIAGAEDFSFEEGIIGIGWAVEWLVQNNFLNIDTDEILDEVDDTIYKVVVYTLDEKLSLSAGTLGKIAYFLKRGLNTNPNTHRYRYICHQECIVILTDNLENLLKNKIALFSDNNVLTVIKKEKDFLIDLGFIVQYMSEIIRVNEPTVENILNDSIAFTDFLLNKFIEREIEFAEIDYSVFYNLFFLSVCYFRAGQKCNNLKWKTTAKQYIDFLHSNSKLRYLLRQELFTPLKVYSLLNIYFPNSGYDSIVNKIISKIEFQNVANTFYNGIGTLILANLSVAKPNLVKHWDELFL